MWCGLWVTKYWESLLIYLNKIQGRIYDFLEKTCQKMRLKPLLKKKFYQKIAFLRRAPPQKLVYFGAEDAFRKMLGSASQKWISQKSTKGGTFGSAWDRIPKAKVIPP